MRAILIEDEKIMRQAFCRMAEKVAQIELVGIFETGLEAIAFAQKTHIDIAFVDVLLPDISGYVVAERIKAICDKTKMVFVTGLPYLNQSIVRSLNAAVIFKPYNVIQLENAIASLMKPI